ncbi:hypothetical protein [Micromonospora sp. DT31]|uniref:hypothetical protein n=1 Tax=Micromonospora sp. DT31 TaxID=3393434 RepID=UPI003CF35E34
MRVGAARAVAVDWVRERMRADPSVEGAFFSGSTVGMLDEAVLPSSSDVDVLLVRRSPGVKVGKFVRRGVLLEVSEVTWADLGGPEDVLGSWVFAPMFRTDGVIADPTGRLAALRGPVAAGFADAAWVRRRCAGVRRRIEGGLREFDVSAPVAQQVLAWAFPTSLVAVWPAVAALADPTVRRRYVRAGQVLERFGFADRFAELLATFDGGGWVRTGCGSIWPGWRWCSTRWGACRGRVSCSGRIWVLRGVRWCSTVPGSWWRRVGTGRRCSGWW